MTRRRTLTDLGVAALQPRAARFTFPDPAQPGHYVRVTPSGQKSFVAVARTPSGKQVWTTIGSTDSLKIEEAREKARQAIQRTRQGQIETKPTTFQAVAENWLRRHVQAKGLLSEPEYKRLLNTLIFPQWGDREFVSIRRSDVAALLDHVEDTSGARTADYCLALVSGICNWYATRDDEFVSPIVRGMRRTDPSARKRDRILSDSEIRAVWEVAGDSGTFGDIVKLCLTTAQRCGKVMSIKWDDVSVDGIWTIPSDSDREKGTGGALQLPELALDVIRSRYRLGDNPYVFPGRRDSYFGGTNKGKVNFDKALKIDPWVVHDLRRTARSLMSRAGVRPEIAERVMGHVLPGVEGVYDRHPYRDEKADALARLANLLQSIIEPSDKVVPIRKHAT